MDLPEFFAEHPKIAIAFSGGVDSTFLLSEALKYARTTIAFYVSSPFQPERERADALRAADELGADLRVLRCDPMEDDDIAQNTPLRCYHCKRLIFSAILAAASSVGSFEVADGTNASDDADDRPGMRATAELGVLSPLRMCGLSKADIRRRSRNAGLFTWDKPAYSCLATRVPTGTQITREHLAKIGSAEDLLFGLGFSDFRVRIFGSGARLQLRADDMQRAVAMREHISCALSPLFDAVMLDLAERSAEDEEARA